MRATRNRVNRILEMRLLERGDWPDVLLFSSFINVFLPSMSHLTRLKHVMHCSKPYSHPWF